jgi:hypothetical protein
VASIAEKSLAAAGLFEAEVLTELLLWRWDHPLKGDGEFRTSLLEDAAAVLRRAAGGEQFIQSVPATEMNLIAAIYYVEWNWISAGNEDPDGTRHRWLDHVRQALPSCFCSQSELPPT